MTLVRRVAVMTAVASLAILGGCASSEKKSDDAFDSTMCIRLRTSALEMMPENPTATELSSTKYQQDWLAAINLITNDPECFSPEIVAKAQAKRQSFLGR